jgi:hypothetical protein
MKKPIFACGSFLLLSFTFILSCNRLSEPSVIVPENSTGQIHPISSIVNTQTNSIAYLYPGNELITVKEYLYPGNNFQTVRSNSYLIPGIDWDAVKSLEIYLVNSTQNTMAKYRIPGFGENNFSEYDVMKVEEGIEVRCGKSSPGESYSSIKLVVHSY